MWAGVAVALPLTLVGCSDDRAAPETEKTPSATPSNTPSTTHTTPATPEDEAVIQLERYLDLRDSAYRQRDIDLKALNRVAVGDEYLLLQSQVVGLVEGNVTVAGQYVHTLDEPRDQGGQISITDCEDRAGVTHKVNGEVREPDFTNPEGAPLRNPAPTVYTLVRDKGTWKVSDSDLKWAEPC